MAGAKKAPALSPAVRKLAALPILVVLGTKRDDGSVQLNPVWFEFEDGFFWLNSNTGAQESTARPRVDDAAGRSENPGPLCADQGPPGEPDSRPGGRVHRPAGPS